MENQEGKQKLSHGHGWGKDGGIRPRLGSSVADLGQHFSFNHCTRNSGHSEVAVFCPTWVERFKHGADARSWREQACQDSVGHLLGVLIEMSLLSGEMYQKFDQPSSFFMKHVVQLCSQREM